MNSNTNKNTHQTYYSNKLQDDVNSSHTGELYLAPSEYKGTIIIDKPITIDGKGSTIWAPCGPVMVISSDNVIIKNMSIEISGAFCSLNTQCAIHISDSLQIFPIFENVEVRGDIVGITGEEGHWDYPYSLNIENLQTRLSHSFSIKISIPNQCIISTDVPTVNIFPKNLNKGFNDINIYINSNGDRIAIIGNLMLKSPCGLIRRIALNAHFLEKGGVVLDDKTTIWSTGITVSKIHIPSERIQETSDLTENLKKIPLPSVTKTSNNISDKNKIIIKPGGDTIIPLYPSENSTTSQRSNQQTVKTYQSDFISQIFTQNSSNINPHTSDNVGGNTDLNSKHDTNAGITGKQPKPFISSIFTNKT